MLVPGFGDLLIRLGADAFDQAGCQVLFDAGDRNAFIDKGWLGQGGAYIVF
ncbi:MAG: hypothetical protein GY832_27650 [Chloroflexi bacterium]|nr:hypothetical protein [Chloroflexota bacterium]